MKRGDMSLTTREQREIVETLRSYGYEGDDPFDRYEMRYKWY